MSGTGVYVFSNEAIRELDRRSVEEFGVPAVVLMENAGRAIAEQADTILEDDVSERTIVICCGRGNNGGDGLVAARHLDNWGAQVLVLACFDPEEVEMSEEAAANLAIVKAMEIEILPVTGRNAAKTLSGIGEVDLIIDALLGTGGESAPRAPMDAVIAWINESTSPVLSVDTPTGLEAELNGEDDVSVRADQTVTFVGLKEAFMEDGASELFGDVVIADIGSPASLTAELGHELEL